MKKETEKELVMFLLGLFATISLFLFVIFHPLNSPGFNFQSDYSDAIMLTLALFGMLGLIIQIYSVIKNKVKGVVHGKIN